MLNPLGRLRVYELTLIITLLFSLATIITILLYYRRIKWIQDEYKKAKDVIEDIIVSFNRQVQKQEERLGVFTKKTDVISSKLEKIRKRSIEFNGQLAYLTSKIELQIADPNQIKKMNKGLENVITTQERIMKRIEDIEKLKYKHLKAPDAKIEAVIPIKREKALAPLTETQLSVLNILAMEGPKNAPEIRNRIKLTREHTARLMKKLYEAGYLERDTKKMPYAYRVKKEMLGILKKTESRVK